MGPAVDILQLLWYICPVWKNCQPVKKVGGKMFTPLVIIGVAATILSAIIAINLYRHQTR